MRLLLRILLWVVGGVGVLALLLVGSIAVEGALGGGRVDAITNTRIPNPNGPEVRAYVARPTTPGPHPAVIMVHEWWGLNQEVVDKAGALAQEGYIVIAPDTLRGSSTSWIPRAIYQVSTTPREQINADIDAVFSWLAIQPDVQPERIAIMGFCYGGRASLLYTIHNNKIAATGIFYGMADTTPDQLQGIRGPILGIFGGADSSIPLEEVRALEQNLQQAGVTTQFRIFENQPHAFVKSIEEIRQGGPQQEAWNDLLVFLKQNIQQPGTANTPSKNTAGILTRNTTTLFGALHHAFVCRFA
jgi:carboxymethylenebutenolidase